jgi:mRNA interferase RelE/StbE
MYSIVFHKKAEEQFKKTNKELQKRIINHLERIRIRPHHFAKKLVGSNLYSLRVGEYRVILDIQNKLLIIYIFEIGHRKNIYRKFVS